jgi:hypothetical protein
VSFLKLTRLYHKCLADSNFLSININNYFHTDSKLILLATAMKKVFILLTIILLQISGFAQFRFYVFPMWELADQYADTILNTRDILVNAGVKQIKTYKTSPGKGFETKTVNLNKDGSIDNMTICFVPNKNNSTFCVNDTLKYDNAGRLVLLKTNSNKHQNLYAFLAVDYVNERQATYTHIINSEKISDTSIEYKYYNTTGQMIKLEEKRKGQPPSSTSYYYNRDGLLDSLQQVSWGTFIFNRNIKRKEKIITMENPDFIYKWIYNNSGQCTMLTILSKRPHGTVAAGTKGKTKYYYNADRTLSKIVVNRIGQQPGSTMYYSYLK